MIGLLAPAGAALVATALLTLVARRLRPRLAVHLMAGAVGSVFVTILTLAWVIGVGALAHDPLTAPAFRWCHHVFGPHHHLSRWLYVPALAVAWWTTAWGVHVVIAWWRRRGHVARHVAVVHTSTPVAYAETGRHGGMVVSTGMLEVLGPVERAALFAHEDAHLEHRHDRFLVLGALASGLLVLRPAVAELRHALERWADEQAAERIGDRRTVAGAIARAALASHDHRTPALGMTGADIPARVEALLAPPAPLRHRWPCHLVATVAAVSAMVGAVVQFHHLADIVATICSS